MWLLHTKHLVTPWCPSGAVLFSETHVMLFHAHTYSTPILFWRNKTTGFIICSSSAGLQESTLFLICIVTTRAEFFL